VSTETWSATHRAVMCRVCGMRGPVVHGDDAEAREAAVKAGWWSQWISYREMAHELAGSCSAQMGLTQGFVGTGHHIAYKETRKTDYLQVCPACLLLLRGEKPTEAQ